MSQTQRPCEGLRGASSQPSAHAAWGHQPLPHHGSQSITCPWGPSSAAPSLPLLGTVYASLFLAIYPVLPPTSTGNLHPRATAPPIHLRPSTKKKHVYTKSYQPDMSCGSASFSPSQVPGPKPAHAGLALQMAPPDVMN